MAKAQQEFLVNGRLTASFNSFALKTEEPLYAVKVNDKRSCLAHGTEVTAEFQTTAAHTP